jgi:hypothetical protein
VFDFPSVFDLVCVFDFSSLFDLLVVFDIHRVERVERVEPRASIGQPAHKTYRDIAHRRGRFKTNRNAYRAVGPGSGGWAIPGFSRPGYSFPRGRAFPHSPAAAY